MVVAPQTSVPQGITHKNITGGRKEPRQLGKLVFHRHFVSIKTITISPLLGMLDIQISSIESES